MAVDVLSRMNGRLGVDTGGTFTDFVWLNEAGQLLIHKQLSTPRDPSEAILDGVVLLGIGPETPVIHGSTVATNALLERRGARTALITTAGFADVLAIGRQNRPDLYALVPQKPEPLVPKKWRYEVRERVTAEGDILVPLNSDDLQLILVQLQRENIQSVAVCLLFSFLRPEHEKVILAYLMGVENEGKGKIHVSLSSEILPEYREYERTATTVINAYVAPLMSGYLQRLADGLGERPLTVMQSNGGVIQAERAGEQAARTVLSGPAGGVVGARFVAETAGFSQIISFDMGGTSTDVSLCPGRLPVTAENEIAGLPLRLPMIDIHTVGAGGGSLAYVDAGGALHVGPQSAGADPGPACYGLGKLEGGGATTTDANLVLGRLDAAHFLGGKMRLDEGLARRALLELARQMGIDGSKAAETAALGVIQVANANMERAIRRISVERGYDPRLFALVAFGGAGPLHACEMARNLQISQVFIPPYPGVLSAMGMLTAFPTRDYSQTVMRRIGGERESLEAWFTAAFADLEEKAVSDMAVDGYTPEALTLQKGLDMRYAGQSHELTVAVTGDVSYEAILARFHAVHETRYGYQQPEEPVEVVTVRLTAVAESEPPRLEPELLGASWPERAVIGRKLVWFDRQPVETVQYDRSRLQPGHEFLGPAVVYQYDTTTVIPPGWVVRVDSFRNLIVEASRGDSE
ncbi:MAG: hydantoinase/oxoprolinase family protein [Candidatus Promineifilaceae bacterium]